MNLKGRLRLGKCRCSGEYDDWIELRNLTDQEVNLTGRYIADKGSHSVLRMTSAGLIYTHAGNHSGGFDGEGPAMATNLQLNLPNSLWVKVTGVTSGESGSCGWHPEGRFGAGDHPVRRARDWD
jgi:hypothetical protein